MNSTGPILLRFFDKYLAMDIRPLLRSATAQNYFRLVQKFLVVAVNTTSAHILHRPMGRC